MTAYRAHATWDAAGWWIVTVPDLGPAAVTQSRRLDQAPGDITEVIALLTGDDDIRIDLEWDDVAETAAKARQSRDEARRAAAEAQQATRAAVADLREAGLSYRDIGTMAGISYQRVQQLVRG